MPAPVRCHVNAPGAALQVPDESFERFVAAFPQRPEGVDASPARAAWQAALARADAETIIAAAVAYAKACEGREPRYIMSARRWLAENRWLAAPRPQLVWIALDTPEWRAWSAFYRATRGKTPPFDKLGGWRFPTRLPPRLPTASCEGAVADLTLTIF